MALTRLQIRFCEEYAKNPNARRAALAAGYSETSALRASADLLHNSEVCLYIEELKLTMTEDMTSRITRAEVINEMARIGMFDVRKLYYENSDRMKSVSELDDDTAAAIESIEIVQSDNDDGLVHTKKIKMSSKIAALKELGKHFNIYEDHQKSQAPMIVNFSDKFEDV